MISSKMSDPNNYDDFKRNGRKFVDRGFHSPILKTVFGNVQVDKTLEKPIYRPSTPPPLSSYCHIAMNVGKQNKAMLIWASRKCGTLSSEIRLQLTDFDRNG